MFSLLKRLVIGIIQIPLTVIYFILSLVSGLLAGVGWIIGTLIFIITVICWLFGEFNIWYQPVIGIAIAVVLAYGMTFVLEKCTDGVLIIKRMIGSL